jgi:hypothetical protein
MSNSSNSSAKFQIGVGAVLCSIIFIIFYRIIMAHFYRFGGYLWDAGWYADVIWRNGIFPINPEVAVGPIKYQYQFHSFFLATPLSLISEVLPLSAPQWFAVVTGMGHAITALCVFAIAARCPAALGGRPKVIVDALLAFAVTMSAPALESVTYPHLEFLYFPTTALFCYAMLSQSYLFIFVALLLVVATREDAGFHLAAPFLLTFALVTALDKVKWLQRWPLERFSVRQFVYFCALPVIFATASLIVPGFFVEKLPLLVNEYFGHPFYGHLSWSALNHQASFVFTRLSYVWLPMLMLFCVAIASRSILLVAASLAYVPWLLFNLLAPQPGNKLYFAYHAFPQFMMYLIPLVVASGTIKFAGRRQDAAGQPTISRVRRIFLYYSIIIIAVISTAFLPASTLALVPKFAWSGASRTSIVSTNRFFQLFKVAKPALGNMVADESVIALAPRLFSSSERIGRFPDSQLAEITKAALKSESAGGRDRGSVDSFLFFENSWLKERFGGMFGPDYRVFGIAGTNMFLATSQALPINGLTTMLEPMNRLYPLMSTTDLAKKSSIGIHIHAQSQRGIAVYGPFVKLPAGRYRVRFVFANGNADILAACNVEVYASGKTVAQSPCVKSEGATMKGMFQIPLDFEVENEDAARQFEFRVWLNGNGDLELTDVILEFCGSKSCDHSKNGFVQETR